MKAFLLSVLLFATPLAHAALPATPAGSLDPTFGTNGSVERSYASSYDYGTVVITQPDGKHVVAGYGAEGVPAYGVALIARFGRDGGVDPAFNNGSARIYGTADAMLSISGAALQPDGRIVVAGGEYLTAADVSRGWLTRLNPDGGTDAGFGTGGVQRILPSALANVSLRAIVLQADGKLLVAGDETSAGDMRPFTLRLLANGQPDAGYGTGGVRFFTATAPGMRTARILPAASGKLLLAGYSRPVASGGVAIQATVVQLLPDGSPDAGFGTAGRFIHLPAGATVSEFKDVVTDGAGAITLTGYVGGGGTRAHVLRLTAAGVPVANFGDHGIAILPVTHWFGLGLARQPDGRLVVTGLGSQNGSDFAVVTRLFDDGSLDTGFGTAGVFRLTSYQTSSAMSRPVIEPDGKIVVAGRAHGDTPDNLLLMRLVGAEIATPVIEFHNGALDHYFITADPDEAAAIDAGAAGPGWSRTGQTFRSGGPNRVCRFYGSPDIDPATVRRRGPNSHFYTIDATECAAVKTDAGWRFESYDFSGWPKTAATCPAGTIAVLRAYNGRFAQNDSNHRYTTEQATYDAMIAQGWRGEGAVFCAPQ